MNTVKYILVRIIFFLCLLINNKCLCSDKIATDSQTLTGGWRETEGQAAMGESERLLEVRGRAISAALSNAAKEAAGVELKSSTVLFNEVFIQSLTNIQSKAIITEYEILDEDIKRVSKPKRNGLSPSFIYTAKVRALVQSKTGDADADFSIEIKSDREEYLEGDKTFLTIKSSKNAFIYIFNIQQNGDTLLLFPHLAIKRQNRISAYEDFEFPDKKDKDVFSIKAQLQGNKYASSEVFMVVAATEDIKLELLDLKAGISPVLKRLAEIDSSKWAAASAPFNIVSPKISKDKVKNW